MDGLLVVKRDVVLTDILSGPEKSQTHMRKIDVKRTDGGDRYDSKKGNRQYNPCKMCNLNLLLLEKN